jgi:hypothetical protein
MRRILIFFAIALFATPAYAQFSIPGAGSAVTISMSPAYPGPNTAVALTVQSALYDVEQGVITWTVNGKIIAQGIGATTARIVTGALGSPSQVQVDVSTDTGDASTAASIMPSSIDLLWEATSYTPPFYKGRALSSSGSQITVVAIPHLILSGGAALSADQITYTWKKDGAVIASASGRGKSSATFDSPMLYGTESIMVTAVSSDGTLSGQATLRIGDTEPQLVLYEDDPLFGIRYHRALTGTTYIPETEMSFTAIPYFSPTFTVADRQLEYTWTVNGNPVSINTVKPNEITIDAAKSSGVASIGLELTHATNYFLDAQGAWNVTFSNAAPNSSGGVLDPFHQ